MTDKSNIIYPVTKETMHAYAKSIFEPIVKGECVTAVWVPMAGRRKLTKFILENIESFTNELPHHDKYLLVYVEPLDLTEDNLAGYLRLMARSLVETAKMNKHLQQEIFENDLASFTNETLSYPVLLEGLKKLLSKVTDNGLEVVFFLGEFDELSFGTRIFYNNLKSLWTRFYPRLHYVFLMINVVESQNYFSYFDELGEVILQNVTYISILQGVDIDYVLDALAKTYNISVDDKFAKVIKELCGGHPYSMIVAIRQLRTDGFSNSEDFRKSLAESYELRSIASGLLDRRSEDERKVLVKLVKKQELLP
jgi:hypothetical protein